jgi:hypothetical protein
MSSAVLGMTAVLPPNIIQFHTTCSSYEDSVLQEVDSASLCTKILKFRVNVVSKSSSLRIDKSYDLSILEDNNIALSRNVEMWLPIEGE